MILLPITTIATVSWAYLTEMPVLGVGCPCPLHDVIKNTPGKTWDDSGSNQERQGTRTGQPERPTGTETKRTPGRADPTSLPFGSWNVMPAVGREQLYLSDLRRFLGRCSLHGSRVGARGQCTDPPAC